MGEVGREGGKRGGERKGEGERGRKKGRGCTYDWPHPQSPEGVRTLEVSL